MLPYNYDLHFTTITNNTDMQTSFCIIINSLNLYYFSFGLQAALDRAPLLFVSKNTLSMACMHATQTCLTAAHYTAPYHGCTLHSFVSRLQTTQLRITAAHYTSLYHGCTLHSFVSRLQTTQPRITAAHYTAPHLCYGEGPLPCVDHLTQQQHVAACVSLPLLAFHQFGPQRCYLHTHTRNARSALLHRGDG